MKSSTTRKTKKNETPRVITEQELDQLTLEVYLYRQGWVVVDHNDEIKSTHRTQYEAVEKGRAMARKRSGRLLIHARNNRVRKAECFWSDPVSIEPRKARPPSYPPVNATRKQIERAVKNAIRWANAEAARQT
jgi:hypothetical protein